jgi:TonB-linked SusC/RagA family outer membrane protein
MKKPKLQEGLFFLMRVTLVHIILSTFSMAFAYAVDSMGQEVLNREVSIDVESEDLHRTLLLISEQTNVKFAYSPELVEAQKKVTLHVKKATLADVLATLLGTDINYKVVGKRIVLRPKNQLGNTKEKDDAENFVTPAALSVSGKVTDEKGSALPGVSILVKGTSSGTSSDVEGKYTVNVTGPEAVLVFSFVGFASQEIVVGDKTIIDVVLLEDAMQLNEIVVTALGIERETKSLTYSVQQIGGEQLTVARDPNLMNSLNGKVAGIQINRASGPGGSTRVILRGNKSTIANQVLYVIDGVPMQNPTMGQPTDVWGQSAGQGSSGRDAGDAISNINPDDIESISILKGASAAALYGSQAANGVILITTKKGKAGLAKIDFSSNFTWENVLLKPDLQFKYGQTGTDTRDSWGPVVNAPDHVSDFWQTGTTWTNSISFSGGTEKAQTYVSYSNTTNKGIVPTSEFDRHTLNFRETAKLLNDKLTVDGSVNLMTQKAHNRPVSGIYNNPLTGLYLFPRGLDFNQYKENFEHFSPIRNMYVQDWWNINSDLGRAGEDDQQNPYWALYRNRRDDKRDRVFGSLSLSYKLADWISIQARGRFDKSFDKYELKANATTQSVFASPNGRYTLDEEFNTQLYGDILLLINRKLNEDLMLSATIGTSIQDTKANDDLLIDAAPNDPKGLNIPNVFSVWNIAPSAERVTQTLFRKQLQGVFASAQLGYKDYLFLDVTARNDWSSAFAYTSTMNKGYFYYSAGVNAVLSEMITVPDVISFAKVRASYAKVGNDVPAYITNPRDYAVNGSRDNVDQNLKGPNPFIELKPEDNRSFEIGTEMKFLDNKIGLDFTYYINNNHRQFITSPASAGASTDYSTWYWNLGNIQNKGVEASLYVTPVKSGSLTWTSTFNFAANKNKVLDMTDEQNGLGEENWQVLTDFGVNMYGLFIRQGGSWGDIYGNRKLKRDDQGRVVVDADGKPVSEGTTGPNATFAGNPMPKFTLGWNNTIDYKNVSISFLIDGRFGGKVISLTQAYLDFYGYSKASADARDNGGVDVPAVYENGSPYDQKIDAQKYYAAIGGRAGIASEYAYSATNVRLREFSIGYKLPVELKGIRSISLSLIGRNLFFISKKAPFDPEITMSTGNTLQGIDVFGVPTTRSYGVNLKVGF